MPNCTAYAGSFCSSANGANAAAAEAAFTCAIEIARSQRTRTFKLPASLSPARLFTQRTQRQGMRAASGAAHWIQGGSGCPRVAEVGRFIGYAAGQFSLGQIVDLFVDPIGRWAAMKLNNAFAGHWTWRTGPAQIWGSIYLEEAA
jgi:hypothetical protein